ncbi:hypothetical protein [Stutzerimonas nitrititolerans]|uniref:hypothetical protein n=1 Tax=Stutzerimonas nitrititolerans TaxID=2482751 RepID=UPI0028A6160F|nr:hypothetical protein [Stutzerimonas nitrititolerans]
MSKEVKRYIATRGLPAASEWNSSTVPHTYVRAADYEALLAERDAARMRVKELDLLFGRYLLAMKAAVIDADQRGDEEGMRWIYNSLAGPGELPAEEEMDAQAFFDREIKPINDAMAELFAALQGEQP